MSSWRNLMTPFDKYLKHESSASTLALSKHGIPKSSEREWLNGSLYNQKLQGLQNEMSRLKDHLTRFSHRENNSKDDLFTPSKDDPNLPSQASIDNSEGNIRDESPTNSEREHSEDKNEYIKLIGNYQSQEHNYRRDSSTNKKSSKSFQGHLGNNLLDKEHSDNKKMVEKENYYTNQNYRGKAPTNSTSNRKSYANKDLNSEQSRENIQEILSTCQNEILDLKDAVMESRMHIEMLQNQLNDERRGNERLRTHLQKKSIGEGTLGFQTDSLRDLTNEENYEYQQEYPNDKRDRKWLSFDSDAKQAQKSRLNRMNGSSNAKKQLGRGNNRENERNSVSKSNQKFQSLTDFRKSARNADRRCDYILEKIADMNEEFDHQEKNQMIDRLNIQVDELKCQKNDMIETFQNIIQLVADTQTISNKTQYHLEIKKDFQKFKDELERKLNKIDVCKISCTLNFSPAKSSYISRAADKPLEDLQIHNYGYQSAPRLPRPSVKGIENNSTYSQPNDLTKKDNLCIESPRSQNAKVKQMKQLWKSHIKDPLSNDLKFSA